MTPARTVIFLYRILWRAGLILVGALGAWSLARRMGPAMGLAAWAAVMAVACACGAWLFHGSPLGRINWRNRVGGYLLPWGYRLGLGRLPGIAAAAWVIWVSIGAAAILLWGLGATATMPGAHPVQSIFLFATWMIYGAITVQQLGMVLNEFRGNPRGRTTMLKLIGFIAALTATSAVLWLSGRTGRALLVAGGPLVAVAGTYGLFLGVMLTAGRNARWN